MQKDTWLTGILKKRTPDSIRILCDLIEAGIKQGHCSANDVRDVEFDEPNIIGATFKLLPKLGFKVNRARQVQTQADKKHKRWVPVWELVDRRTAWDSLDQFKAHILGLRPDRPVQEEMEL